MMTVIPLKAFTDNYIWLILEDNPSQFSCVDPGDATPVIHYSQQHECHLTHILLTHHHHDHIGGVDTLIQHFPDCQVYGPHDSRIGPFQTAKPFTLSQVFFAIFQTPGHTSSHISYFAPEKKWLFCGDTLFSAGCGRVFDGTMEDLYNSMQFFKQLPDDTLVFSAHEYTEKNLRFARQVEPQNTVIIEQLAKLAKNPKQCTLPSTLAFEKQVNPFLRLNEPAVQEFAKMHGAESQEELAIFSILRKEKDAF